MLFQDRADAGRALAETLGAYADRPDVLVLALPRGGVPVGFEVARALKAPLDVFVVRKLGVPGHEELAMGAIATGGVRVLNEDVVRALGISDEVIDRVAEAEEQELERREWLYRGERPPAEVAGRTVILIDDGLATGASMRVAIAALAQRHPARMVVAVPVASPGICDEFRHEVDEVAEAEGRELERREQLYRGARPPLEVAGKTAILIDDGLATGSTMRAGVAALRRLGPSGIVVAVPVAAAQTCDELRREVEEVVCAETPEPFYAVGLWYRDFSQTSDAEVSELLERATSQWSVVSSQ